MRLRPEKLLERGIAAPGLLAHILVSKYCDHFPLYRQDRFFPIEQINLPRQTVAPLGVGKKNWFFFGEARAGQRGAIIYTIIETCRPRGIDPYAYLHDIFTRQPN